jgi:predicted metal-dependent hydrolase
MSTEIRNLRVSGLRVAVVRKAIKNLYLGVYPPDGHVRVAAPLAVSDAAVRVAVIGKLPWIHRRRAAFARQERESPREMVSGESHDFLGRRYRLVWIETRGRSTVALRGQATMELRTPAAYDVEKRERVLQRWYREQLRELVPPLIDKWEAKLAVQVAEWRIKKMKTRWGSCNPRRRRIWINLELAKKPPECLEYLVVHELAHLRIPDHGDRFRALMDRHIPRWRAIRKTLNAEPLASEC